MPGTQGYAVVSCHVERPLDDEVWRRYTGLLRRRPGGFVIASLMRAPADGEDDRLHAERAREAATYGPLGHHTHWTSPTDARPTSGVPSERVLEEGRRLREHGIEAKFFCGGGWYMDAPLMSVVAELGYTDCTATAWRPEYLPPGAPRAALDQPAWVRLDDGRRVLEVPTTHSLGAAARSLPGHLPRVVHVHFHDYELLDSKRRLTLDAVLVLLARRRRATELGALSADREVAWADVWAG
jgi:hypothetical protein